MADNSSLSQSAFGEILAHLRSLRASLTKARDALVHFKHDRVDRDKLEPAARRVDDLMNLFTHGTRNPEQGSRFVAEIQVDIAALLEAMRRAGPDS